MGSSRVGTVARRIATRLTRHSTGAGSTLREAPSRHVDNSKRSPNECSAVRKELGGSRKRLAGPPVSLPNLLHVRRAPHEGRGLPDAPSAVDTAHTHFLSRVAALPRSTVMSQHASASPAGAPAAPAK